MNLKAIILILNTIYLIVAISWAIINISFETVLAIIGGLVSFTTFFVANNNSFSVTYKKKNKLTVNNNPEQGDVNIERQINTEIYTENNYKQ